MNSIIHLDDDRERESSPSSPSCDQDNVSSYSSTISVHSKSQFTSDEESNPVIHQYELLCLGRLRTCIVFKNNDFVGVMFETGSVFHNSLET